MEIDIKTKELIYRIQNQQKISIYMALLSPFGVIVFGFLFTLFFMEVFDSIVPVFIIGGIIMLYFFRKFVTKRKHEYEELPIFTYLISLRNFIRMEKEDK
jgi:membrane protein YdbS with pleckstrin-like domain